MMYDVFCAVTLLLYRMIAYELAIYVGLMLGSFAAGYAYEATNATTIFIISTVCILAALFLMAALLPESLSTPQQSVSQGFVIVDLWRTCSRSRQFVDRSILVLLMCIMLLTAFVSGKYLSRITTLLLHLPLADGSNSVFYMFMRAKFHWSVLQFTQYETVSILVPAVAGSGGMLFLWSLRQVSAV